LDFAVFNLRWQRKLEPGMLGSWLRSKTLRWIRVQQLFDKTKTIHADTPFA
jgi:hypothetical protein